MRKLAIVCGAFSLAVLASHYLIPGSWLLPLSLGLILPGIGLILLRRRWLLPVILSLCALAAGFYAYAFHQMRTMDLAHQLDGGAGGRGERFDWQLPERMERPYILAGGLDSENVAEAVRRLSPWGVDVSSGVETDGLKDEEKIRRFAGAVRGVSKEPETKNKG